MFKSIFQKILGHSNKEKGQGGYLVEIRLYGPAKKFTKDAIYTVSRRFRVRGNTQKNPVPHVSLYGPFSTNDLERVILTVRKTCEKYAFNGSRNDLIMYKIAGFKTFQGAAGKVICLDIIASEKLNSLTTELADGLNQFCKGQVWDIRGDKLFHATIAFRDASLDWKHKEIMKYLSRIRAPHVEYPVLRVTLIKPGRKILCEYDLIQKRLMNREQALDKENFHKTISMIREIFYGESEEPDFENRMQFAKRRNKGNVKAQKKRWKKRRLLRYH